MVTLQTLLAHLLNGLAYSLLLFLLAAGLSLIFGMMNVINLAHGSFFMLGAFAGISFNNRLHNFWLALLLTIVVIALLGLVAEATLLRPLYRRGHLDQILMTFGLALIIEDASQWLWGTTIQSLAPPAALSQSINLFGAVIPSYRLFVIVVGLLVAAGLWWLQERTRIGSIIRAGVSNPQMVSALGINLAAVFAGVIVFGVALAAFAGFVGAPILGAYAGLDFSVLILALIIVVVGGLGSLTGAFWSSLLIGMSQTLGQAYVPGISMLLIYLIMAAVLLLRPEGLFQRKYG